MNTLNLFLPGNRREITLQLFTFEYGCGGRGRHVRKIVKYFCLWSLQNRRYGKLYSIKIDRELRLVEWANHHNLNDKHFGQGRLPILYLPQ